VKKEGAFHPIWAAYLSGEILRWGDIRAKPLRHPLPPENSRPSVEATCA